MPSREKMGAPVVRPPLGCPPSAINISGDGSREPAPSPVKNGLAYNRRRRRRRRRQRRLGRRQREMWRRRCSYGVVMHASRVLMNTLPSISAAGMRRRRLATIGCDVSGLTCFELIPSLKMPVSGSTLLHSAVD